MDELQRLTQHVQSFGLQPPTTAARAEVEAALQHKWHGIQATAAKVLATWGDRDAVEVLKQWLLYGLSKQRWSAIRQVAIDCLAQCISPNDVDWVVDLVVTQPDWLIKHEFIPLLVALPSGQRTRTRLQALLYDHDWKNRQIAVLTISRRRDPERNTLLQQALHDEHSTVRTNARFGLDRIQNGD